MPRDRSWEAFPDYGQTCLLQYNQEEDCLPGYALGGQERTPVFPVTPSLRQSMHLAGVSKRRTELLFASETQINGTVT